MEFYTLKQCTIIPYLIQEMMIISAISMHAGLNTANRMNAYLKATKIKRMNTIPHIISTTTVLSYDGLWLITFWSDNHSQMSEII